MIEDAPADHNDDYTVVFCMWKRIALSQLIIIHLLYSAILRDILGTIP